MIRFLADEDFNNDILRGLRRRAHRLRVAIDDLLLINDCGEPGDWANQVTYLPLR